jgi:acyl dehydratase
MDAAGEECVQSLYGAGKYMDEVFLEDLAVGKLFGSGRLRISAEDIKRFAAEYDPQPFHLDEQTARSTIFRGLAASGWHTAALTMRLLVDSEFSPSGGLVGAGLEELRWPRPVRPGDELRIETEILALRPSRSRSGQGIVKIRVTTFNQADKPVQIYVANVVVLGRRKEE